MLKRGDLALEGLLRGVLGARSVFAERTGEGYFLDTVWNRERLARYGVTIEQAAEALASVIGGENVTTTVERRARYPVNVRYMRDFRSDVDAIGRVLVPVGEGKRQIPLASVRTAAGPAMIRDEDGLITGYVYVDVAGAARRIRPKFMTVATTFIGLVPILWATGTGSDVMKRIAAPMVGGILTSFRLELLVYPAIHEVWRWRGRVRRLQEAQEAEIGERELCGVREF